MEFDIVLALLVFILASITVLLYRRFKEKADPLLKGRRYGILEVALIVLLMGVMVTVMMYIPAIAIQVLLVIIYSYVLFTFFYIIVGKNVLAALPSLSFILCYLLYPNSLILNIFAVVFAITISMYLSLFLTWRTSIIFLVMLTIMDVIQVFFTGFMLETATKLIGLRLPVAVVLSTYPSRSIVVLGLGDIFLSGLLAIQTGVRYGRRAGYFVAGSIGLTIFIFETMFLNGFLRETQGFPATVIIISGWLMGVGAARVHRWMRSSLHYS